VTVTGSVTGRRGPGSDGVRSEINREPFASNRGHFARSKIGRKIGENGGTGNMSLRGILAGTRPRLPVAEPDTSWRLHTSGRSTPS